MVSEAVRAVRGFRGVRPEHQAAPVAGREREFRLRGGVREEARILQGGREIRVAGHQSVRFRRPGKEQHREVARRLRIRRTGTVEARRGQERPVREEPRVRGVTDRSAAREIENPGGFKSRKPMADFRAIRPNPLRRESHGAGLTVFKSEARQAIRVDSRGWVRFR